MTFYERINTSLEQINVAESAGVRLLRESPVLLLSFFKQVCSAIAHLHSNKTLHRDIKPGNVLLILDPPDPMRAAVADFGIAALAPEQGELTATQEVVGTPTYRAPESLVGNHTAASDVYGLGKTLEYVFGRQTPTEVGPGRCLRDPSFDGAAAGLVLGYLGVYIVLRRMVFISAAITHSAGLGVALAFYTQIYLGLGEAANSMLGAFVLGMGATLVLAFDPSRTNLTRESIIGLLFIFASGAALLVGDRISQESHDIHAILFGTAVLVRKADLYATLGEGGVLLGILIWLRPSLVFASFDPDSARVQRLPVRALDALLLLSVGLMVSVTTRALGAMPVFAFSVLPAMTGLGLSKRIGRVFGIAAVVGALSAVLGYAMSFFWRFPVGASQTVVAAAFAAVGLLVARLR